ncbi:MAG: FGGY-family carbohydrate kinase [Cyanobacteriota bacterium]|jgi:sugar (pentulose or hexulose) kinase
MIAQLPLGVRQQVRAMALAGTSGTVLLCRNDGTLLDNPLLSQALPYHQACPNALPEVRRLLGTANHPAAQASGSLARALTLLKWSSALPRASEVLIRHQADWLMGWLLGDWRWGEEGNNLRLGWDLLQRQWLGSLADVPWAQALPQIVASGTVLGTLAPAVATDLGLPSNCLLVAGTTDANAAVLAADPGDDEGVTVLGTTLVLKQFVPEPIQAVGLSNHRVNGRWLLGGASNSGAGILLRYFTPEQIVELSRQIDPTIHGSLKLRPLLGRGERFPEDDPQLEPILDPRPVSDASYLQALLEGITTIEQIGWQRLRDLGAPPIRRILTLGGGARNPQWRRIRQRILGLPIVNKPSLSAAQGMARLAQGRMGAPLLAQPG